MHKSLVTLGTVILLSAFIHVNASAQTLSQHDEIGLHLVAEDLTAPVYLTSAPDDTERLFILDQVGFIYVVDADGNVLEEPFLDLTDHIVELRENFDERGLLGLAFHPEYAENGRFFVYYSAPLRDEGPEDWDHTSHVSEFLVSDTDANLADVDSERVVMQIDQPQFNHNGGTVAFGADGYLYVSLGDGGGAGDVGLGHTPDLGNSQDVSNLLGSILRIDIDGDEPYEIPPDNPFVGQDGADEIYAYGLRNPYRITFDRGGTNQLFAADAGQNLWEWVNLVELGGNYGWNTREGSHCFDPENPEDPPADCPETGPLGEPLIDPVIEYPNATQEDGIGAVIIGGFVYRGEAMPDLVGHYVFGDWSRDGQQPDGIILSAEPQEEGMWPITELSVVEREDGMLGHFILGFGQDHNGELYLLTTDERGPSGSTGRVYQIIPTVEVASEVEVPDTERGFALSQAYPNPVSGQTQFTLTVSRAKHVTVEVFDVLGRRVSVLHDGTLDPLRQHSFTFDARELPAGVYVYRATAEDISETRTVTVLQ